MIEKTLTTKTLHQGLFLDFVEDKIQIEGTDIIAPRQYFKHPGGVVILAVKKNGNLILVKQFRKPIEEIILEFPAGKKETGEDDLSTAKRELLEETGYSAANWHDCGEILPCPGYSTEKLHVYIASKLDAGKQNLDYGEIVEIFEFSEEQLDKMILSQELTDSKTISLYMIYKLKKAYSNL